MKNELLLSAAILPMCGKMCIRDSIEYHKDQPEELAVINYTSGTTSYSKGVMPVSYTHLLPEKDAERVVPSVHLRHCRHAPSS